MRQTDCPPCTAGEKPSSHVQGRVVEQPSVNPVMLESAICGETAAVPGDADGAGEAAGCAWSCW